MTHLETPRFAYTSNLTSKGQVTIPVEIRRLLGIAPRDKVAFVVSDGKVQISPARSVTERTAGMLRSELPRLPPDEEKTLIEEEWASAAASSRS